MNNTPRAERVHIAIYGRTNSGKSSLINAITGQSAAIVSNVAGTTTDPVSKSMEVPGLGAVTLIDTAGFDDRGTLGAERLERTLRAADSTDVAIVVFAPDIPDTTDIPVAPDIPNTPNAPNAPNALDAPAVPAVSNTLNASDVPAASGAPGTLGFYDTSARGDGLSKEVEWINMFRERRTPVIAVINKADTVTDVGALAARVEARTGLRPIAVSAKTHAGIDTLIKAISQVAGEPDAPASILGDMVSAGDVVVLVMPQDSQAPNGRLILPQVQVIRELLDRRCIAMCCVLEDMASTLRALASPPQLIVTDSQAFGPVSALTPPESRLTSFSVLMAHYKGDVKRFIEGAAAIDRLTEDSRVLIAEACTHAPASEDIGRVKIPAMLRRRVGEGLRVDVVGGTDFPEDLTGYDLVIHCGACMFNRRHVLSRIERAAAQGVPITNYGIAIAHLTSILGKVSYPGAMTI